MASDGRLDYSVYSGRRAVAVRKAWSGAEAVIEYLTTMGVKGSELAILGPNSVAWRDVHGRSGPRRRGRLVCEKVGAGVARTAPPAPQTAVSTLGIDDSLGGSSLSRAERSSLGSTVGSGQ